MTRKSFVKTAKIETVLYFRSFFGPFFSLLFPIMMLILFGSIYGNEPTAFYHNHGAMDVSVPAYLGMVIAVGGIMTLPLGLLDYQTTRVYKRFDATPVGKTNIALVQILVYLIACIVSSAILVGVGKLIYNINIVGKWYVILPAFLLSLVSIFSIGFLISTAFKNTKIAQLVSYLLYFLMIFTSGTTLPSELLPESVRTFSYALPLTHAVDLLKSAFSSSGEVMLSIIVLSAVTIVCVTLSVMLYRRRQWI